MSAWETASFKHSRSHSTETAGGGSSYSNANVMERTRLNSLKAGIGSTMRWVIDSATRSRSFPPAAKSPPTSRAESGGNADEFMVELITGEILAAEWYRHAGAIAVEVEWQDDNAILDVYDQGPELDLAKVTDPMDQPPIWCCAVLPIRCRSSTPSKAIIFALHCPRAANPALPRASGSGSSPLRSSVCASKPRKS